MFFCPRLINFFYCREDSVKKKIQQTSIMCTIKSRIAFIDTSGYITDCNLSALSPQHAMKPYRVLATNELCGVLHIE